jgi:hypothetical protein
MAPGYPPGVMQGRPTGQNARPANALASGPRTCNARITIKLLGTASVLKVVIG